MTDPQKHIDLAKFVQTPSIRRELSLNEAQINELTAIEAEMKEHIQEIMREMRTLDNEERKGAMQEIQDELELSRKLCADVLSPEQLVRAKQLALQFISRGPLNGFGLLGKAMMKELDISEEQANQLRERSAAIEKQLTTREAEMKAELEALRVKLQEELINSLKAPQRAKAKALYGDLILLEN